MVSELLGIFIYFMTCFPPPHEISIRFNIVDEKWIVKIYDIHP